MHSHDGLAKACPDLDCMYEFRLRENPQLFSQPIPAGIYYTMMYMHVCGKTMDNIHGELYLIVFKLNDCESNLRDTKRTNHSTKC